MKTKRILEEIERFSEKNSDFDVGFHILVEGIKSAHSGIALLNTPAAKAAAVRSYFEQARSFLSESKQMLDETDGLTAPLKGLIDRYGKFCDRVLAEI